MWRSQVAAMSVVLAASSALGEPTPATPDGSRAPDLVAEQAETGSTESGSTIAATWEEVRRSATSRGLELSVVYDGEGVVNTSGGGRTGTAYVGNLHLQLAVDGKRLLGWPGATLFLNGLGTHGGHPSALVGDAQGVSSLEAPAGWQLYEAWFQQH